MFRMMDNLQYCSFDFRLSRQMSLQTHTRTVNTVCTKGPVVIYHLGGEGRGGEGSKDSEKNNVVFRET